jgi:hypothetical protein
MLLHLAHTVTFLFLPLIAYSCYILSRLEPSLPNSGREVQGNGQQPGVRILSGVGEDILRGM